jgi:lipoyl-dependent peroxiredoxin
MHSSGTFTKVGADERVKPHSTEGNGMPTRTASAVWEGGLKGGSGTFKGQTGLGGSYNFGSRFEYGQGSNPEELLAAAHAACFSMALSGALEKAGATVERVETTGQCTVEKVGEGFSITTMKLSTRARAQNIDNEQFQKVATSAKENCPVSRALTGLKVELDAALE